MQIDAGIITAAGDYQSYDDKLLAANAYRNGCLYKALLRKTRTLALGGLLHLKQMETTLPATA